MKTQSTLNPGLSTFQTRGVAPTSPSSVPSPDSYLPSATEAELYGRFLARAKKEGASSSHLAYLDRGYQGSFLKDQLSSYPARLHEVKPSPRGNLASYPVAGQLPKLEAGLEFLHKDIQEACVCVGSFEGGELKARWHGRNATSPVQMWSATKAFPMMRVAIQAQAKPQPVLLEQTKIPGAGSLPEVFDKIVSYDAGVPASNALSRTLKQFDTPEGLDRWLKSVTGNKNLTFKGGYGAAPTVSRPNLVHTQTGETLLKASGADHSGENLVSAYDLCRTFTNLAWHSHLHQEERMPGLQRSGVGTLARSLGKDSARFVDVALEELGIKDRIQDVVVLSKLGFGNSSARGRWESVYASFVSFTDTATSKTHQVGIALRGNKPGGDAAAVELDARMAAQVAMVLQNVVNGQIG